jgi:hypothetical protein
MQATKLPLSWLFQHLLTEIAEMKTKSTQKHWHNATYRHRPHNNSARESSHATLQKAQQNKHEHQAQGTASKSSAVARSPVQLAPDLFANKPKPVDRRRNYPGFQPALPRRSMGTTEHRRASSQTKQQ